MIGRLGPLGIRFVERCIVVKERRALGCEAQAFTWPRVRRVHITPCLSWLRAPQLRFQITSLEADGFSALERLTDMKRKPGILGLLAIQFPRQGMFLHTQSTARNAVLYGDAAQPIMVRLMKRLDFVWRPFMHIDLKRHVRLNAAPRVMQPRLQFLGTPNVNRLLPPEQGHGAQQTRQPEHMVAVHVADEYALELLKSPLAVAQRELHPLPRIDQIGVSVNVQKLRRGAPRRNRHRRSCSEKHHVKRHHVEARCALSFG